MQMQTNVSPPFFFFSPIVLFCLGEDDSMGYRKGNPTGGVACSVLEIQIKAVLEKQNPQDLKDH